MIRNFYGELKMDLKVIQNNKNELFKRQEIVAEVEENVTPSKDAVREKISAMLNAPKEKIVIGKIDTEFGSNKVKIIARIYDDEAQLKKVELEHIKKRNFKEVKVEKKNEEKTE